MLPRRQLSTNFSEEEKMAQVTEFPYCSDCELPQKPGATQCSKCGKSLTSKSPGIGKISAPLPAQCSAAICGYPSTDKEAKASDQD